MNRKWMKFPGLAVAALSLVLWSCDSLSEPGAALTGPGEASHTLVTTTKKDGHTVIKETSPNAGAVAGVIGEAGGKLVLGQHVLEVPAGAVSGPTTFSMTDLSGEEIKVGLTATKLLTNDVGSAGFAKPVRLTLSYKNATEVPSNESDLKILWVKADGSTEAQPSSVDVQGKRVIGQLSHFSDYAIGFPNTTDSTLEVSVELF